ncbi:SEL1-like repeat protein [Paraglaciecola sp. L3A3]|uniref:tetratricopeptide repeat protein n=1 Tax=Paraglaciecola sp. L3A3 TaxID=2686358 RepID=UPI00131E2289|nr:SEL1-like repeat protein [Paraglaciecola sp. L3A3]
MKIISRALILTGTILLSAGLNARDLLLADHYFAEKKYELALKEYKLIADVGNPRAYYQLGVIHFNGFWVETNFLESLIWFSLAAEQDYKDSKQLVEKLFAQISVKQKEQVANIVADYLLNFGKTSVTDKFYPSINEINLGKKVVVVDNSDRFIGDLAGDEQDTAEEFDELAGFADSDDLGFSDQFNTAVDPLGISVGSSAASLNLPYFLIVDYDIETDGSRRNLVPVTSYGYIKDILYTISSTGVAEPTLEQQPVPFIGRSYQGSASYGKSLFRDKTPILYRRIRRLALQLQNQSTPIGKYQYAHTLMSYTWLNATDEKINQLLKESSEAGVIQAQLEYGLKLYRDQDDIKSAVKWILEAAKQTNTEAEYRLGKILLNSPWVIKDEKKAVMWLESAANKRHVAAIKDVVYLRLLADDQSLRNTKEAIRLLDGLTETQNRDPVYHYLRAVSHTKSETRQLSTAFKHMRTAISLANDLDWNTDEWQAWLQQWTEGVVTVQDL